MQEGKSFTTASGEILTLIEKVAARNRARYRLLRGWKKNGRVIIGDEVVEMTGKALRKLER